MIDLGLLREKTAQVIEGLKKKDPAFDGQQLYDLDCQVRKIRLDVEQLRHKKNEMAAQAKGGITPELREASLAVSKQLKEKEQELLTAETAFNDLYLACPNLPEDDLPIGNKEANKVIKVVGEKPTFSFEVKNHLDLAIALGWLNFDEAAVMTGSNFALYKGDAVKMIYALTMMMLKNNIKHGYEPILPPYLVNEQSLIVASNFPKFKDQVFAVTEDKLYLTPTAEVNLASLYRHKILSAQQLPIRLTAWTSCFRREAGGYGANEKGLIRMHQFEKVELYTLCEPQNSAEEQERMLASAEDILQKLGLHYRVSLLATQDCSFPSAKTYDIEVWFPHLKEYREVSSISNCTDFQARRGLIRYKKTPDSKTELVHTLNGSSLALSRLMVAIFETYQQADGSIAIPQALKKEGLWS